MASETSRRVCQLRIEAELISTGSELLSGRTVNRHAQTLGSALSPLGIRIVRDTSVGDEHEQIKDVLQQSLARSRIVFISGGLGPTSDDITRQVVAEVLGRSLVVDKETLARIQRLCLERGLEFNQQRAQQAEIVAGAKALPNKVGAAPGELIKLGDESVLFILPGPPAEFCSVLNESVLPWISENISNANDYAEDIYLVTGRGESDIISAFEKRGFPPKGIDAAYCAAPGRIEVRLCSNSADRALLSKAREGIREILGDDIFAEERCNIEEVLGSLLRMRAKTVAVAESCTGGLLGSRITAVPGSSTYFKGGIISYSNEVKIEQLGVQPDAIVQEGAVSATVASQMAVGVREKFGADFGISTTGIAGPEGGSDEKPVGLVYIGLSCSDEVQTSRNLFGRGRTRVRESTLQTAIDMLRRKLI